MITSAPIFNLLAYSNAALAFNSSLLYLNCNADVLNVALYAMLGSMPVASAIAFNLSATSILLSLPVVSIMNGLSFTVSAIEDTASIALPITPLTGFNSV